MAGDIPTAVLKAIENETPPHNEDTDSNDTVSSLLDASIESEKSARELPSPIHEQMTIKNQMLLSAAESANIVCKKILEEEERKTIWRKYFIIFLSSLLVISVGFIGFIIVSTSVEVSDELIIALLVYIVANIFSLLYFMVKYITDNKYIDMYKTTYHKILDFLIQDKVNEHTS